MKVRKAVIPAAGMGTRLLPATKTLPKEMLPIIEKPTIQYIVEEAVQSGIESILIVTGRGKQTIEDYFDSNFELETRLVQNKKLDLHQAVKDISNLADIQYIRQKEPLGLGHAIWCARNFIGDESFAILLGDTFFESEVPALKQIIECSLRYKTSVLGVQSVHNANVHSYGIIDGTLLCNKVYSIHALIEKPRIQQAPSNLAMVGRYVLTPAIFDLLGQMKPEHGEEIQLTEALNRLNGIEAVYAYEVKGKWFDVGNPTGYVKAILSAIGQREELLEQVKEELMLLIRKVH